MSKEAILTEDWVEWIRQCHRQKSDFQKMMDILLDRFDSDTVNQWVNHIWFKHNLPENSGHIYNVEFSWMRRDLIEVNAIRIEYLSLKPVVAILHNILSTDECRTVVEQYRNDSKIARATVHDMNKKESNYRVISDVRTNSLMHLGYLENPIVTQLEKELQKLLEFQPSTEKLPSCSTIKPANNTHRTMIFFMLEIRRQE